MDHRPLGLVVNSNPPSLPPLFGPKLTLPALLTAGKIFRSLHPLGRHAKNVLVEPYLASVDSFVEARD